ncbi:uncharacterized protein LOC102167341 isoform X2 [Sus scrofa]|uniref:uncharacterized protein LOC102167341 isoform X2 n=1 Tax=Sus scrofa TaxID=9823 RepID=UPI000A2B5548|nr:uncharacterized protein LOC102167341 isoform X2 [Sus scrofa]
MAKKRGAETLLFLLFLDYWQGAELHPLHLIKGSSTEFSSSSNYMDKGLAKLFGYPQQKSSRDAKFTLSSSKQEEHLARLFDEILLQVFSKVPYDAPFDETRQTVDKSVTKRTMKESHIAEEKREKESSLFNRDVSDEPLTTTDKGALQEASSPSVPNRTMPCAQLLQFLQRNIISASAAVAGILVATVLLLLVLITYIRRKQLLYPPENMTYNIFIMNGKTWWQKSQEKKTRKHTGKQKQLKLNSSV